MLRLLSSKIHGRKNFRKSSKPCHVGIYWTSTLRWISMCRGFSHFPALLRYFTLSKLATSSGRVVLMLLVANLANTKWWKNLRMTENLANGYSFKSTHWELSNEYQHDMVQKVFKDFRVLVPLMKVASALEGLSKLGCKVSPCGVQ